MTDAEGDIEEESEEEEPFIGPLPKPPPFEYFAGFGWCRMEVKEGEDEDEDGEQEEEDTSGNEEDSDSVEPFIGPLRERPPVVWCGDRWMATEVKQYARPVAPEQYEYYMKREDRPEEEQAIYWTASTRTHEQQQDSAPLSDLFRDLQREPDQVPADNEEEEDADNEEEEDVDKETSQEEELLAELCMMSAAFQAAERIHNGRPLDGDLRLVARARRYIQDMKRAQGDLFKVATPPQKEGEEDPN
jgi:hypothetical protein